MGRAPSNTSRSLDFTFVSGDFHHRCSYAFGMAITPHAA
jgi:hypothetical protein